MQKTFRPGETRPAGYVFTIPAQARHLRDNKPARPFLLLTRVTGSERGTLALMTTKSTEDLDGATLFELIDQRGRQHLPGQERSYVNLSSLLFRRADGLTLSRANHARHIAELQGQLKHALGIGSGVGPGPGSGSIRGHLVRLTREIAEMYEFELAVVLTEHRYSSARRLQALVPVVDVRTFLAPDEEASEFAPDPGDVLPSRGAAWVGQIPLAWELPVIDTVRLASFSERWEHSTRRNAWLEQQIEEVYPVPLDAASLAAVEAALVTRLGLPA